MGNNTSVGNGEYEEKGKLTLWQWHHEALQNSKSQAPNEK
jgi:hypothetical protein